MSQDGPLEADLAGAFCRQDIARQVTVRMCALIVSCSNLMVGHTSARSVTV